MLHMYFFNVYYVIYESKAVLLKINILFWFYIYRL